MDAENNAIEGVLMVLNIQLFSWCVCTSLPQYAIFSSLCSCWKRHWLLFGFQLLIMGSLRHAFSFPIIFMCATMVCNHIIYNSFGRHLQTPCNQCFVLEFFALSLFPISNLFPNFSIIWVPVFASGSPVEYVRICWLNKTPSLRTSCFCCFRRRLSYRAHRRPWVIEKARAQHSRWCKI